MTVHVALDTMGGDREPEERILGALQAVRDSDVEVTLLGDQQLIEGVLQKHGWKGERLHVVHTSEVISMHESPFDAVRKKKDSSIVVAFDLVKQGKAEAVVSAGNSGATMAAAIKYLGRLKNISRPGIASLFPTLKGPLVMMDVGANVDCRPQHLFQFGIMAAAFSKVVLGNKHPRIGLLSIGEEGGKGNALVKETHKLFTESKLNYIGNVEGRDTFLGDVDVMVCDGFVGNVCLKLSEGLGEAVLLMLREEISKNFLRKLGYFLAKSAFKNFKKRVDYTEYGGAPLLGMNGTGIVCHGRSNAKAIRNAIFVAADLVHNKVNDQILSFLNEAEGPLGLASETPTTQGTTLSRVEQ